MSLGVWCGGLASWRGTQPSHRGATSALAGSCKRGARRCSFIPKTAQRDEVDGAERRSRLPTRKDVSNASPTSSTPEAEAEAATSATSSSDGVSPEGLSPPFLFSPGSDLPNLACDLRNPSECLNISSIEDPRLDPSMSRLVRDYVEQLVGSGVSQQRAAQVIREWSDGGGLTRVDLRKLRRHFLWATLLPVLRTRMPEAVLDLSLTAASFWSLGQLPGAGEQVLHPAVRGALVALNLLMLVGWAAGSVRTAGRVLRLSQAALHFSNQAELVLLALQAVSDGHGQLVLAAAGSPAAAALAEADVDRILLAAAAAMRHAKRQAAVEAGAAAGGGAVELVEE
ncbi:hypothetical protein Agub_g935, partial [Astrephomene gubernaculifera]